MTEGNNLGLNLSIQEVKRLLATVIKDIPDKTKFVDKIVDTMYTSDLEILLKIALNTFELPKYKIGDCVKVKYQQLYISEMDEVRTKAYYKNDTILQGIITDVHQYDSHPYVIECVVLNKNGEKITKTTSTGDHAIAGYAETIL
jgi:hypothetical protein